MERVRHLATRGLSSHAIADLTGVPVSTVVRWRSGATAAFGLTPPIAPWRPPDPWTYAYLLGLYLGDGHVLKGQGSRWFLRIYLDGLYPQIVEECRMSIVLTTVGLKAKVLFVPGSRVNVVQCCWKRWTEAFPQHGPGRKHERPIVLAGWQQEIVDAHPEQFVRGLIHSDGCRTVNRFTTKLPSGRVAEYEYPRYFFSNLSEDIRRLFSEACEAIGVRWTQSNHRNISVSHRKSVAILEEVVGPKT
jgi:hypothetical protein